MAHISILLCEDDKSALEYLTSSIKMVFPDSSVYGAADGLAGLESFRRNLPDIVITDINMPAMGGLEMLSAVKSTKSDTKTILITAYGDKTVKELVQTTAVRIDHCIFKPLSYKDLFRAIEECASHIGAPGEAAVIA